MSSLQNTKCWHKAIAAIIVASPEKPVVQIKVELSTLCPGWLKPRTEFALLCLAEGEQAQFT